MTQREFELLIYLLLILLFFRKLESQIFLYLIKYISLIYLSANLKRRCEYKISRLLRNLREKNVYRKKNKKFESTSRQISRHIRQLNVC